MATSTRTRRRTTGDQLLAARPSRRAVEPAIHLALQHLSAAQTTSHVDTAPEPTPPASTTSKLTAAIGWAVAVLLTLAGLGLGVTHAAAAAAPSTCAPITYTVVGAPPAHVLAELDLAVGEIRARSGLRFVAAAAADAGTARLVITWSDRGLTARPPSPAMADQRATRLLGYGEGLWQRAGGVRTLLAGKIEIDATASWPLGMDRGNSLAAVFTHELGHVLGLEHSSDRTSFMYDRVFPEAPHWTADDLAQLDVAGQQSGCGVHNSD